MWIILGLVPLVASLSSAQGDLGRRQHHAMNILPNSGYVSRLPPVDHELPMPVFWAKQLVDEPLVLSTPVHIIPCDAAYVEACSLVGLVNVPETLLAAAAAEHPKSPRLQPSPRQLCPRGRLAYGLTLWGFAAARWRGEGESEVTRRLRQAERFLRPTEYLPTSETRSATARCRQYAMLAHAIVMSELKPLAGAKELKALGAAGSHVPRWMSLHAVFRLASLYESRGEKELARNTYSAIITRFVAFRDWSMYRSASESLNRLAHSGLTKKAR